MSRIKEYLLLKQEEEMNNTLLEYQLECYYEEMKEKYGEENIKDLLDFFSPLMEEGE